MNAEARVEDTGIFLPENDLILSKGQRYSQDAIKGMTVRLLASAPNLRYRHEMLAEYYLWFIDALSEEELIHPTQTPLIDKLGKQYGRFLDSIVEPDSPELRNIVLPNIETAAKKIDQIRSLKDDVVVVLNHGKWNGFPHLDYALMYHDVMAKLKRKHIKEEDVIFIIGGETNDYIRWVGEEPFLNTAWRLSMMANFPFDIVSSTGQYESSNVESFWVDAYKRIRPDYLVFDPSDKSKLYKVRQAREVGIKTLPRERSHFLTYNGFVDVSHTAYGLPEVSGLSEMLFGDEISRVKSKGAFERKANWRDFLMEKGLL